MTQGPLDSPRRLHFHPAALFAAIVAILGVSQAWQYSNRGIGFDFYQFWVAGSELRAGSDTRIYTDTWRQTTGERYYRIGHAPGAPPQQQVVSEQRRLLQTFSSPLLYAFFSFIGASNYLSSLTIFKIIAMVCGIASILILCRLLDYSPATSILVVGVMIGWFQPFLSDVFVGNVNQLQLLMLAVLLWVELRMTRAELGPTFQREGEAPSEPLWSRQPRLGRSLALPGKSDRTATVRDFLGGALLALMALFKPNLLSVAVLLGVMWLVDGAWIVLARHVIGVIVAAIVLILLSSWRFGTVYCWIDWFGALHRLGVEQRTVAGSNCGLVELLREQTTPAIATGAALVIGLLAIALTCIRRRTQRTFVVIALGAVVPLLTAPVTWLHYYIFCTPLLLLMAKDVTLDSGHAVNGIVRYLLAGACFLTMSIATFASTDDPQTIAVRMVTAAFVLFAFGLVHLWRARSKALV